MHKMILTVALVLSFVPVAVLADRPGSTYRAGNKVLSPGDSAMRVKDTMGEPESKEPVQNKLGAEMGEYWYYQDGNKTVKFFISGGRIVSIEEFR